jgi:hypothetical protein
LILGEFSVQNPAKGKKSATIVAFSCVGRSQEKSFGVRYAITYGIIGGIGCQNALIVTKVENTPSRSIR